MGFIADFKARRAAKRAQAQFELESYQWQSELDLLNTALDIFTNAAISMAIRVRFIKYRPRYLYQRSQRR